MALKSGSPTTYRQQITRGVGETYKERRDYEQQRIKDDAVSGGLLGKVRDFFFGAKSNSVHQFAANAEYVREAKAITACHKDLEHGVKSGYKSADTDLLATLSSIIGPKK